MSQSRNSIEFTNHQDLEEVNLTENLSPPNSSSSSGQVYIKAISFTASKIKFSYQTLPNNRVIQTLEKEKFLIADLGDLRYDERQAASNYIVRILDKGILINNRRYNYLGQSNSHLKEKKCLLYQANKNEIQQILNRFGDWSKFNNVAKLAKRIGLLFSSGQRVFILKPDKNEIIDDVEINDYCFTDGCGFVSKDILKIVAKNLSLSFRENRYYPSVIQIRYQGFKGILLLGTQLRGMVCHFRKSMSKFKYRGPNDFFVVGYSRPYSFGRLNTQTIMLISSLGVPDDVFIRKQEQHFNRLELMFTDLSIAFEYLLTIDQVELAGELIENGFTEKVLTCLRKSYNGEFGASLKSKKTSSGTSVQEKLRIMVQDSRIVFAASDPTGNLEPDQCFFRPTIQNKPTTIIGPIFCVRNPCYHAGDVVVLNGVDLPECQEIVDVVLFSVNGDVPTAHRSAGGDLDGDKFFVCWDKDLMPRETVESYSYPGVKEKTTRNIQRIDLIKGFANQSNAGTARCANLFEKWANANGPRCDECIEINKLFSHAVDGSSVNIPEYLTKPPTINNQIHESRIWNKLVTIAKQKRLTKLAGKDKNSALLKMDREELRTFLEEEGSEATDYEMLNFLIRWCRENGAEDFREFLYYIDFSSFNTYEKIQATAIVPRHLLYNALNMSRIIGPNQISYFKLGEENYHWKLFHSSYGDNENGIVFSANFVSDLLEAIKSFRRVFVAIKLNHELTFCISLYGNFEPESENDAENRIIVYGFNQSGMVMKKKPCSTDYKLFYSEGHFQLYRSDVRNTFIWLGVPKKLGNRTISLNDLYVESRISVAIDKLCNQTAKRSSRITKTMITESEIYIVSNRDGLLTRNKVVNSDYEVEMEKIDIDADYNPPDPLNPENDRDKELLAISPISSPTDDFDELMERMECWAKYGAYDKTIKACDMFLMVNRRISCIQNLIDFAARYPIIHGPLTSFVTKSCPPEFPSIKLIKLIEICMNAVKGSKDALVMEHVMNLLNCPVPLSMYQIIKIVIHFILDYPDTKMAKEYLEEFFFILEKKQMDDAVSQKAVTYFMRQIRLLCTQTLEEFTTQKKSPPKNRYQARKGKAANPKRYSLISKGPVSVKVRPGDLLMLKRLNRKSVESISVIRAVVISTEHGLNVDVSWAPRDIEKATWKVKNIGNTIGFKQSIDAIKTLYPTQEEEITTLVTSLLEPENFATSTTTDETVPHIQGLNPSQQKAVNQAENGHLTLWQGPAGTGKTKSIFQLILKRLSDNPELPILVSGATNAAVDNIAKLLVEHGNIKTIRIGDMNSILPELHEITLEARLDGSFKRINSKKAQQLLQEAKVICATCVGSGASLLEKFEFDLVIVDEASQVSEPICLIPLSKKCERFALVGDHKQLRPFCLPMAEEAGYNISLFERMVENSYPISLLDTQYRMHPKISEFPNRHFYQGKLKDGIAATDRPLVNGFAWPNPNAPVAFVQVSGKEESSNGSKYNQAEVDSIFNVVKTIASSVDPMDSKDIGIISLYSAQLEKMKTALGSNPSVKDIEVKTADGFQGREKQLILITCVRCNEIGNIGFLEDEHRFNVMLTRAKRGLIIFGDQKTLCTNKMWKDWFEWATSNNILYKA